MSISRPQQQQKSYRPAHAAVVLGLLIALFATGANAGISFVITAPVAPPPLRMEAHQVAPFHDAVWIDGRWSWSDGKYLWVNGHWEHRLAGSHGWHPGDWQREGSGWVWHSGRWF
jgi:hypothetical protein